MDSKTIGILGGGQLGRMVVEAAHRLNVKTVILDAPNSPAKQIHAGEHVDGSFKDPADIAKLAAKCDVITIEIEHVNADTLADLQKTGVEVHPSPETIRIIQDKYRQKEHLVSHGIPVAESYEIPELSEAAITAAADKVGYPCVLKAKTMAYDGRGNFVLKKPEDAKEALEFLSDRPLYVEKWCPFTKELAVMVVRSTDGTTVAYPTVETVQKNNICHTVYAPARDVPPSTLYQAQLVAENAIKTFTGAGIFGVEMFLLANGEIILNEIAPRPHNSGHYTTDACATSQFEAHVRAILGLPLFPEMAQMRTADTHAIMLNILGGEKPNSELEYCKRSLSVPGSTIHLYGKTTRAERKMGHINIVASSMDECERRLAKISGEEAEEAPKTVEGIAGTSKTPLVSIIMGSDSDLKVMSAGADILRKFNIPFELTIVSAHRTAHRMAKFAAEVAGRGVKAVIAGAGGAAHLPGMVASETTLPVIGVPVKGSSLDGVDSLYSIVQMPRGIPVATMGVNNSTNAALLAIRILAAYDTTLHIQLAEYIKNMEKEVLAKAEKLETIGYEEYLNKQ